VNCFPATESLKNPRSLKKSSNDLKPRYHRCSRITLPQVLDSCLGTTFDYTAKTIDGMNNEKFCEKTTFYPTDTVRDTVLGSDDVALDQVQYRI
jgi:hypothetical protein